MKSSSCPFCLLQLANPTALVAAIENNNFDSRGGVAANRSSLLRQLLRHTARKIVGIGIVALVDVIPTSADWSLTNLVPIL